MKKFQLSKILKVGLVSILIIPIAYAAPLIGTQKCQLGETCRLGSSISHTYYPVKLENGTSYSCTIKATDSDNISVSIVSYQNFDFKSKELNVDNNGTTITINGRFTGMTGAIKIRQTSSLKPNGIVNCKANT